MSDFIYRVQAVLEDNWPYTLVPTVAWMLLAWPLYLVEALWPEGK